MIMRHSIKLFIGILLSVLLWLNIAIGLGGMIICAALRYPQTDIFLIQTIVGTVILVPLLVIWCKKYLTE